MMYRWPWCAVRNHNKKTTIERVDVVRPGTLDGQRINLQLM